MNGYGIPVNKLMAMNFCGKVTVLFLGVVLVVGIVMAMRMDHAQRLYFFQKVFVAAMSLSRDGSLKLAVDADDVVRAEAALNKGADPNHLAREGGTLLMEVCEHHAPHSVEMANALLAHGADVNIKDDEGNTALMAAAWGSSDKMVQLLLQHGAKVDAENQKQKNAVYFAKVFGDKRIILRLEIAMSQSATNTVKSSSDRGEAIVK